MIEAVIPWALHENTEMFFTWLIFMCVHMCIYMYIYMAFFLAVDVCTYMCVHIKPTPNFHL